MAGDVNAEINVTPMIDVLLSLLIIFLVASPPPPNEQQPITIPQQKVTEVQDNPDATLLVTIDDEGKAKLGEEELAADREGMIEQLKNSEKAQSDSRIAINASEKVPYGQVMTIMGAAREAGIESVGLASDRL